MARFEIEANGKRYEVEAPDINAAMAALGGGGPQTPQQQFGMAFDEGADDPRLAQSLAARVPQRGSWIDPVMQGVVPFADELAGGVGGLIHVAKGAGTFGEGYDRVRNRVNEDYAAFKERNPYGSMALEVAGSVPTALALPLGAAAKGAGLVEKSLRGAAAGGAVGAAYGAGQGDSYSDRALNALYAGGFGLGVGGAAPAAGAVIGKGVKYIANRNRPPAAPGVDPLQRMADADTFQIPLTQGQRTGNLAQTADEEAMRHAARGAGPAETMQAFARRQGEATNVARQGIQDQLADTRPSISSVDEAGEMVTRGVRDTATGFKNRSQKAYSKAEAANPVIRAEHVREVQEDFVKRLTATDFPFDEKLHPTAFNAMKEIDRLAALPDAEDGIIGISLKGIEIARRRMLATRGTNPDDMRAMKLVRGAFDDWIDDAVDRKLFDGDPAGLDALKEARANWSKYRAITDPKTGDDAGRVLSKMVKNDVNGQEVGNWLFGSSIVNPPATTVRVAKRLKSTLGADSDAWGAVRQAAWIRATRGKDGQDLGPQALSSAIHAMVDGRGKALARQLFTPDEISLMRKFANVQRSMVPDPRATNPSKSSYGVARVMGPIVTGLASALGLQTGGIAGAIGAAAAVPAVRSIVGNAAARRATNPKLLQPLFGNAETAAAAGLEVAGRSLIPAFSERRPPEITLTRPNSIGGVPTLQPARP